MKKKSYTIPSNEYHTVDRLRRVWGCIRRMGKGPRTRVRPLLVRRKLTKHQKKKQAEFWKVVVDPFLPIQHIYSGSARIVSQHVGYEEQDGKPHMEILSRAMKSRNLPPLDVRALPHTQTGGTIQYTMSLLDHPKEVATKWAIIREQMILSKTPRFVFVDDIYATMLADYLLSRQDLIPVHVEQLHLIWYESTRPVSISGRMVIQDGRVVFHGYQI